jgi:protoporphyrinogen oxidase
MSIASASSEIAGDGISPHSQAERRSVAVLGGGIAGMIAARYLAEHPDLQIDLYERSDRLGGLHRSVTIGGREFDVGAFAFAAADPIFAAFPGLIDEYQPFRVSIQSVLDGGEIDAFPRTVRGYARRFGLLHMAKAGADLLAGKLIHRRRDTVSSYCKYYLGKSFYERSGLKSYIERLYSRPDGALDVQFARQRLPDIARSASLRSLMRRALSRGVTQRETWHGYARPKSGFQRCYGIVERALQALGVTVNKSCAIQRIARRGRRFELRVADETRLYDQIISTIPVPVLAKLIGMPTEAAFETMKLVTLFYRFTGSPGYDAAYLYNFTSSGLWKRVIDFSIVYDDQQGGRWLSVEVTRPSDRPSDIEAIRRDFETQVRELGLFKGELAYQGHWVTPNAYPVFNADGEAALDRDRARIEEWGIHIVGRQGRFEYLSSAAASASARAVADELRARAA